MSRLTLQFHWQERSIPEAVRSAVSLHSHTRASEEAMDIILDYASCWPVRQLRSWVESRYLRQRGTAFDWSKAFWTPPLTAEASVEVEQTQIATLGLHPMVSLTDHDNCDAGLRLQGRKGHGDLPIATEWTVPFGRALFHLGIHNLPRTEARGLMAEMADYTRHPAPEKLRDLLHHLDSFPEVLVVVNHPLYDEAGIGGTLHGVHLGEFLTQFRGQVHALELNGLRRWSENLAVMRMAQDRGLPYVSGGDRHGSEPNANLNLTPARTFPEFVHEVRFRRRSHVLFLPQYRGHLPTRQARMVFEVAERWRDRLFYREEGGAPRSLVQLLTGGAGTEPRGAASAA